MEGDFQVGGLVVLQHVLDQVDASARAIELVAEFDVGRAGRRAEPAVDAALQNLLRHRDVGVGELGEGEVGLHGDQMPAYIRPGLRMPSGSKASLRRRDRAITGAGCVSNTATAKRTSSDARTSVA